MEAIKIILEKEKEEKLFDRKVNGIKYWEYVRPIVSGTLNSEFSKSTDTFANVKTSYKKYFLNFKNIKKYFLPKKNVDILIVTQNRRIKTEEGYKNNYTDYYVDILKKKYNVLVIEEPSYSSLSILNVAHTFPIYTKNMYLTDLHELSFILRKKMYYVFHHKKLNNILKEYNYLNEKFKAWLSLSSVDFKKYFVDSLIRLDIDKNYIKKIYKKTQPKMVMFYFMPSVFKIMMIKEANDQKIPTVEIQHGTTSKYDPIASKCLDVSKLECDLKYIFSFGDRQVNKFAIAIKDKNNIIPVGFPYFEEKLKNIKKGEKKYILIISQSTIGNQLAIFTSKLAQLLKNTKYKIVFKYHPLEMEKEFDVLNMDNIIQVKNEKTIYSIQQESILQIGVYSTSLYEGFAQKVPTLIVKNIFGADEAYSIFEGINKGVYFIQTPDDVLKFLTNDDILPVDKDIQSLWASNSQENILKAVNKILR